MEPWSFSGGAPCSALNHPGSPKKRERDPGRGSQALVSPMGVSCGFTVSSPSPFFLGRGPPRAAAAHLRCHGRLLRHQEAAAEGFLPLQVPGAPPEAPGAPWGEEKGSEGGSPLRPFGVPAPQNSPRGGKQPGFEPQTPRGCLKGAGRGTGRAVGTPLRGVGRTGPSPQPPHNHPAGR